MFDITRAPQPRLTRRGLATASMWVVVAVVWVLTVPALGVFSGDHGTYISVAQRLIAGDRLYVDVWDNKDPLFFYALAMARAITPYGDIILEVLWLLLACGAAAGVARAVGLSSWRVTAAAWVLTPMVLIGATYVAGMTHLPGSAISMAALACALYGRWPAAGALLGVLILLKLPMVPVPLVMLLVVAVSRRQWRGLALAGYGVIGALGAVGLVMLIRGELIGYVLAQWTNVSYSSSGLIDTAGGSVLGHLLRVVPQGGRSGLVTLGIIAGILVFRPPAPFWKGRPLPRVELWWCTLLGTLAGVGVLGLTGMWTHHLQILYLPGALAMMVLLGHLPYGHTPWYRTPGVGLLVVAAYLAGGAEHPLTRLESPDLARVSINATLGQSDEARDVVAVAPTGRYARLGTNDVSMHAKGLEAWTLVCRRFHQYAFDPQQSFAETIECLPDADVVILSSSFNVMSEWEWKATVWGIPLSLRDDWNGFVERARAIVDAQYRCDPRPYGALCVKVVEG